MHVVTGTQMEEIFLMDVQEQSNDLEVTYIRGRFYDRLPWSKFKSLRSRARDAVGQAGWEYMVLDQIAELIYAGWLDKEELDKLRNKAREK
ncbi:hypothetical protein BDV26DRAFT_290006 [Aspergillus bertholletiae]|uniref:Uncharacterized protein n=1 Tax=Aspergillus bertholletiae TaxID=1226010 RepID=A0A5N7BGM5_9EURO|nr:hypothetical protein BDV26DRAFT_290006 [Aspergillus bertholletiae]